MTAFTNYLGRYFSGLLVANSILVCLAFQPEQLKATELKLLVGQEQWHYKEVDDLGDELDREQGTLNKIQADLLLPFTENFIVHSNVTYNKGRLKYIGHTQAGVPHTTVTATRNTSADLTLRYTWQSMYFGAGLTAHVWQRNILAANNISHLHELYRWLGPQLELGLLQPLSNKLTLELGLSGAWLSGDLEVDLTQVPGNNTTYNFGKPKLRLKNGYDFKAMAAVYYPLNQRVHLLLQYQQGYRHFPKTASIHVSDGSKSFRLHEPKSTNHFYYYSAGIILKF